MSETVIELNGVEKSFGPVRVLRGVSMRVGQGQTFAFLGCNGAGKTTTLRILMGLLEADGGTVRVFGYDPGTQALAIRQRVGFLAEDQAAHGWMRVDEAVSFVGSFHENWDMDFAASLIRRFELPHATKCKHLSKGQSVRLGLLMAMAHRPPLVILDDPTLGLDPLARRQFLQDIVGLLQDAGTTVFFSSHLLYEIEPIADQVAILHGGRIVACQDAEVLRDRVRKLLVPADCIARLPKGLEILNIEGVGDRAAVTVGDYEIADQAFARLGVEADAVSLNLDEIFHAYVAGRPNGHTNAPEPVGSAA